MVRRIGSSATPAAIQLLVEALAQAEDSAVQRSILQGLGEALKGRRQVAMPAAWPKTFARLADSSDREVRSQALALGVTFGDANAFATLRRVLADGRAEAAARQKALTSLVAGRDRALPPVLHQLVGDASMRGAALRGLAGFDDPKTPAVILAAYPSLTPDEKRDALNTLAARVLYAQALLQAIAGKKIAAADVSADIVRQMRNLQDKDLDQRIAEVWGIVRATPADRAKMIAAYRKRLTAPSAGHADVALGRAVFAKTCQQCHTLFGVGGTVGPNITGSNRANLDYLLENILDPSAVIPKEYAASVIGLTNGRVITGIVRSETAAALTVVTATETLTVSRADVDFRKQSDVSMMPDDLLKPLTDEEVHALFAYLRGPTQTPIRATVDNAPTFFNGKDLAGWDGDAKIWRVEDGAIVGTTSGHKEPAFLRSQMTASDFRLTAQVKLAPAGASGAIHFRGEPLPAGDVKGPRVGIGKGQWGRLSEAHGRGGPGTKPADSLVKPDEWNALEVIAEGSRIRVFLNGKPCVDLDDPEGSRRGIFAIGLPAGGSVEVRLKDLRLEVLPPRSAGPRK
jgi:putative heme-binding domain-containing protein